MEKVKLEQKEARTPNRSVWKNLKATYKYAKNGKKYLILFLIGNIIMTIISIIIPIIIAKRLVLLTSGLFQKLLVLVVLVFVIEILRNITRYFSVHSYHKFYYDVRQNLQLELTRETLKIAQRDLNTNSTGTFIERINNDTDNLTDIFANLIDYITGIIGSLGILISIFFISIYLGFSYVLLIIVMVLYNKFASNINYKKRKEWKKSREKTGGFISEIVRGAKDIKILDAEESFLSKANLYMEETNDISRKYQHTRLILRLAGGSLRDVCDLLISLLTCFFLIYNLLSIELALIIMNYHYRIVDTADWIEQIFEILKQFNLAANRIFGILEEGEFEKEHFGTQKLEKFEGNIEFKNVCFEYEENIPILKNMNFKINANETIGFEGPSGAGKTTIFNLISALELVNKGSIEFDGMILVN